MQGSPIELCFVLLLYIAVYWPGRIMPPVGDGARPKDKPSRSLPPVNYKALHEGTAQEIAEGESWIEASVAVSPGRQDAGGIAAATAESDLDRRSAQKGLEDLDREIEKLESSIKKVKSQLKESSVRKEKKQRTERIARLRKELFVAEQQLEKSQEEGELQSRKLVSQNSQQSAKADLTIDTGIKSCSSKEPTLPELREMSGLNADVDRQMNALGLLSDSSTNSSDNSDVEMLGTVGSNANKDCKHNKKSLKSGLYKKSSDTVKYPQIWPHSALQYEFVSESVSFMSLDIKMFVAGELEIILSKRIPATEKLGRLKF